MKTLLAIICLLVAYTAFAGSADAIIKGKTSSERTNLEISVGDISGLIRYVRFTIDGETIEIADGSKDVYQTVIHDPQNGIYVLVIEDSTAKFVLWMIPGTEKVSEEGPGYYKSRFAAVIQGTDPRRDSKYEFTSQIVIGCTLDWRI